MSMDEQISADQIALINRFQAALGDACEQAIGLPANLAVAVIAMVLTNVIVIGCDDAEQRSALVDFITSNLPSRVSAAPAKVEAMPARLN